MMKKYVVVGFLCIASVLGNLQAKSDNFDKLLDALKNIDEKMVFQMVIMENATVDKESKEYLVDSAEELVAQKEKSISWLKSGRDLGICACGLGFLAAGGFFLGAAYHGRFNSTEIIKIQEELRLNGSSPFTTVFVAEDFRLVAPGIVGAGLSLLGLGSYYAIKGWMCKTALNLLERAQRIQGLIKKISTSEIKNNK